MVEGARRDNWRNWADVRATFPSADLAGSCVVFNVGGNHYRLIAFVHYSRRSPRTGRISTGWLYVRPILTHAEYDRGRWQDECGE